MFCSECGKEIPGAGTRCPACGHERLPARPDPAWLARPALVTLLAVLQGVGAMLYALLGLGLLAFGPREAWWWAALLVGLATVFAVCAHGLWKLRRHGRIVQLTLAWIGLLAFPVGTVISALVLYYFFQPRIKLLFSGKSLDGLTPAESLLLADARGSSAALAIGATVAAFALLFACGLVAAIAVPNLLHAIDRGKQKRTMADIRAVGEALEAFASDHGQYPEVGSIDALHAVLHPGYITAMPRVDGWQHPLDARADAAGYMLRSPGKDGDYEPDPPGGPQTALEADIIFSNGEFVQWPEALGQ